MFAEAHLSDRRTFLALSANYALRPLRWFSAGVAMHFQTTSLSPVVQLDALLPIADSAELCIGIGAGPAWFRPASDSVELGNHIEARLRALWAVTHSLDLGLEVSWVSEVYAITYPPSETQGTVLAVPVRIVTRWRF